MLQELLLKTLVSEGLIKIKKILSNNNLKLIYKKEDLTNAIFYHNNYILNSTKNISFKELEGNRNLITQYVQLSIELQSRRHKSITNFERNFNIEEILNHSDNHIVLLGGPGAGKTTTIKYVANKLCSFELSSKNNFPILIYLRDLDNYETIYSRIKSVLSIDTIKDKIADNDEYISKELTNIDRKITNTYLDSLNPLIILDGLDEVSPSKLSYYYSEIESLTTNLNNSRVLLTCRDAAYNRVIKNLIEFEISSLKFNQIELFVRKWFSNKDEIGNNFMVELKKSKFYDLSLRPLFLSHLCTIYEKTGKFYDKPKLVFKKLVRLLIEEWDEQRGIHRESVYSEFETDTKFDFLCHFAYVLTTMYTNKSYSEAELESAYDLINKNYNLPKNQARKVVREIEEHNGIIVKSSNDSYEFAHKSMQEYLSAEYIVKIPFIPKKLIFNHNIANEFAIAVCLSSEPNLYYYNLVFESFTPRNIDINFFIEFLKRLIYESPSFKCSYILPLSFMHIYHLIIQNYELYKEVSYKSFEEKLNDIINDFRISESIDKSFKLIIDKLNYVDSDDDFGFIAIAAELEDELSDDELYYYYKSKKVISTKTFYMKHFSKTGANNV